MAKPPDEQSESLGEHLASLRKIKGMTLREVEEATNKNVSNAYLSQLEKNKITRPSPNVLHALSEVYSTSYEDLMRRAGYVTSDAGRRAATFAVEDLTPDEEKELLAYLAFIRQQRRK